MRTGTACQAKQVGHRQRQRLQQPQVRMVLQKQTPKQSHLQAGPCPPGAPEPRHQEVRSGLRGPNLGEDYSSLGVSHRHGPHQPSFS
ncbi:hypothetical protein VZT92_008336 [Zoarces viviparus]|uniref:Uncharacterized protein n=1 Tax=Zoarces viviparus TaxID=48416 RepID=A0AAW1FEC7_ZOAVI